MRLLEVKDGSLARGYWLQIQGDLYCNAEAVDTVTLMRPTESGGNMSTIHHNDRLIELGVERYALQKDRDAEIARVIYSHITPRLAPESAMLATL